MQLTTMQGVLSQERRCRFDRAVALVGREQLTCVVLQAAGGLAVQRKTAAGLQLAAAVSSRIHPIGSSDGRWLRDSERAAAGDETLAS